MLYHILGDIRPSVINSVNLAYTNKALSPYLRKGIFKNEWQIEKDSVIMDNTITAKILKFNDSYIFKACLFIINDIIIKTLYKMRKYFISSFDITDIFLESKGSENRKIRLIIRPLEKSYRTDFSLYS